MAKPLFVVPLLSSYPPDSASKETVIKIAMEIFYSLPGKWLVDGEINNYSIKSIDELTNIIFSGIAYFTCSTEHPKGYSRAYSTADTIIGFEELNILKASNGNSKFNKENYQKSVRKYQYQLKDAIIAKHNMVYSWNQNYPTDSNNNILNLTFYPFQDGFGKIIFTAEDEYICGNDCYKASYKFQENLKYFQLKYKVKGPDKNFLMNISYSKIA